MAYTKSRPSREPQDAVKIAAELEKYKTLQETMKAVNAHWRSTGTCFSAPGITDEQAKKLDMKVVTARAPYDRVPFSTYDLTNNNSKIKRLEQNLSEVSRGFEGWDFDGGRAEANADINRLQLFFDEKPTEAQRTVLKARGFKWSPSQDAWQRQLTDNAIYSAGCIDFIKPSDGRTVRAHQPQAAARDTEAR